MAQALRIAAVASLVLRWWSGDRIVRAQTSWVLAVVVLSVGTMLVEAATAHTMDWAYSWAGAAGTATVLAPAIAMGVAIVRFHLFEIDRLVSRTIAYAAISVVLAATFVGASVGLAAVLGPFREGEAISVSVATLLVASMFSTLRRRVQGIVDAANSIASTTTARVSSPASSSCVRTSSWTGCAATS